VVDGLWQPVSGHGAGGEEPEIEEEVVGGERSVGLAVAAGSREVGGAKAAPLADPLSSSKNAPTSPRFPSISTRIPN